MTDDRLADFLLDGAVIAAEFVAKLLNLWIDAGDVCLGHNHFLTFVVLSTEFLPTRAAWQPSSCSAMTERAVWGQSISRCSTGLVPVENASRAMAVCQQFDELCAAPPASDARRS